MSMQNISHPQKDTIMLEASSIQETSLTPEESGSEWEYEYDETETEVCWLSLLGLFFLHRFSLSVSTAREFPSKLNARSHPIALHSSSLTFIL
jgi:hypothetical protein